MGHIPTGTLSWGCGAGWLGAAAFLSLPRALRMALSPAGWEGAASWLRAAPCKTGGLSPQKTPPQVLGVPPELALNAAWGTGMWQEKRGLAGRAQPGAQPVLSCSGHVPGDA